MNWEATKILLDLMKEQFIIEHNKSKDSVDSSRLKNLRTACIGLHEQRIALNVAAMKGWKLK